MTGIGKFTQPLKKLKRCGDVAVRLLLLAYRENNLAQFGGISPSLFYEDYKTSDVYKRGGYTIWHGNHEQTTAFTDQILLVLGLKEKDQDDQKHADKIKAFWDATKALDTAGFIYQMVSIMDRKPGDCEAQVIYELDAKSKHGYKPNGEQGLGGVTAKLSAHVGYPVTDSTGRFYGKYAAILPTGIQPHIVGIYRLRFRVSNSKNYGVADAWTRIYQGQDEAYEWIVNLAEQTGFELENDDTNSELIDAI